MKPFAALSALAAAFLLAAPALATVTEPNGVVIPLDSMNGEVQLYTLFQQRGEPIDYQADAHETPAVFSPLCDFSAEYILNEAGSHFGLAWYNADPAATQPPPDTDLHVIVPANSSVGTMITSAQIRNDPAYRGGLVGFALVGGQTHYSESQWNPVCTGCATPGPWVMAVMYRSVNIPNAYYLAFEDGNVDATSYNNDGDYNDDVFLLTGLACEGEGQPCDTGMPGVCALGVTACDGTGNLACQPTVTPSATETCDGLDNNCDGTVDENAPCPNQQVCDRGQCHPPCGSGEFPCAQGLVCNDSGACVDPDCATVQCPAGQVCQGGACVAPCDGVVCPHGEVCRAGRCVDPCAGVTCEAGHVCQSGVCVTGCDCLPCPGGLACAADGRCVEAACATQTCGAGEFCQGGACVSSCQGAVCPRGQACTAGECVDVPDAGVADAGARDAGGVDGGVRDAGGRDGGSGMDGGMGDAGAAGDGGDGAVGDAAARDGGAGGQSSGCGCAVPGGASGGAGGAAAVMAAVMAVMAGRKRGRR